MTTGPLTNNTLATYTYNARNQLTERGRPDLRLRRGRQPHRLDQRSERDAVCRQPQCEAAAGADAGQSRA